MIKGNKENRIWDTEDKELGVLIPFLVLKTIERENEVMEDWKDIEEKVESGNLTREEYNILMDRIKKQKQETTESYLPYHEMLIKIPKKDYEKYHDIITCPACFYSIPNLRKLIKHVINTHLDKMEIWKRLGQTTDSEGSQS